VFLELVLIINQTIQIIVRKRTINKVLVHKQQMDRVMGKLNHWDRMRGTTYSKRASDQQLAEIKMQKKMSKIEKFGKE
jgi:hypothetical protein